MKPLIRTLQDRWIGLKTWVDEEVDPRPIALFRLWFGFLCLVNVLLLWPDMYMWFGNEGVLPPELHQSLVPAPSIQLYAFFGYGDRVIWWMRFLGLLGGVGLVLGIFPRVAAFIMWFVASSYAWRNSGILHSGDSLIRVGCFFLMFARSDHAYSLRSLLTGLKPHGTSAGGLDLVPAWPQRVLQVQLCVVYLVTGIWKFNGLPWRDGSAVATVLQLGEFERFPVPDFMFTPWASSAATYFTLGFELVFPFLVWVPRLRLPMLMMGLALHAGMEWMMNVQLFQWVITSYYLLFIQFDNKATKTDT